MTANELKACAMQINATGYLDAREFLRALFEAMKKQKENYTYRQFSEDLGFGHTNYLHLILQGKRPISVKAGGRIAESLALKGTDKLYFLTLVRYGAAKNLSDRETQFQTLLELKSRVLQSGLDKDQLSYFSEWYHPVIREIVGLPDAKSDPEWIAEMVFPKITPDQARKSLDLLVRIGYLSFDEAQARYVQNQTHVRTAGEVRSIALVRYHQRMIEIGRESITRVPPQRRDISALTLTVSEGLAKEIKTDIQNFRKYILDKSENCPEADQVVQINIQMFPFTKARGG